MSAIATGTATSAMNGGQVIERLTVWRIPFTLKFMVNFECLILFSEVLTCILYIPYFTTGIELTISCLLGRHLHL